VVALVAMMLILWARSPVSAADLVVNSFGGSWQKAMNEAWFQPFMEKYNVKLDVYTSHTMHLITKIRAHKGGASPVDVLYADILPISNLLPDNMLQTLDPKNIPNMDKLYKGFVDPKLRFVGAAVGSIGIVYNTRLVKTPPTSWLDLWRPEFKGKVALGPPTSAMFPFVLTALARTQGGDERNIDPAFEKLKELMPNVLLIYPNASSLLANLVREEVWIGIWANDRAYAAKAAGTPVDFADLKEGRAKNIGCVGIPVGAKNKALGEKYINFILSEEAQAKFGTLAPTGPANPNAKLPPEVQEIVPYGFEEINKLQYLDVEYVMTQWPKWIDRFNREIATIKAK